jgi:GNAT superfamily N-acetyltransferase
MRVGEARVEIIRFSSESARSQFEELAHLHMAAIHHGVLPLLGHRFLTRMYYELARAPRTGVWGVAESGRVLGFLAGSADVRVSLLFVVLRGGVPMAWLAGRSIFTRRLIRKLLAVFAYPFQRAPRHSGDFPRRPCGTRAEILAVAVDKDAGRRGVGKALVRVFEEALAAWGVTAYRVTTNVAEHASNSFYRMLGLVPCGTMRHHDLILQVYEKELSTRPV